MVSVFVSDSVFFFFFAKKRLIFFSLSIFLRLSLARSLSLFLLRHHYRHARHHQAHDAARRHGKGGDTATSNPKRALVVKLGSGAERSFVRLPEDADAGTLEGTLGDGAFVLRCGKKKEKM